VNALSIPLSSNAVVDQPNFESRLNSLCAAMPECAEYLRDATEFSMSKPDISLFRCRQIVETVIERTYTRLTNVQVSDEATILELLDDPIIVEKLPAEILAKMHFVRRLGNRAVHRKGLARGDVSRSIECVADILEWTVRSSSARKPTPPERKPRDRKVSPAASSQPEERFKIDSDVLGGLVVGAIGTIIGVLVLAAAGAGLALLLCLIFAYRWLLDGKAPADTIMLIGAIGAVVLGALVMLMLNRRDRF
jgi:hypothetical protein